MNEQKNTILAVALSVLIFLGFNYFYEYPRQEKLKQQAEIARQFDKEAAPVKNDVSSSVLKPALTLPEALQASPRLEIKTDRLKGSLTLKGCHLDDLHLLDYRETIDKESQPITLLSPEGVKGAYYAKFGWVSAESGISLPDSETVWQSDQGTLSQVKPVVLEWNNGKGLKFRRTIAVDDQYMFTIKDQVTNAGEMPVTLGAYGQVNRLETPPLGGYMILHEGAIGVLNGKLKELTYENLREKGTIEQSTAGGWLGITDKYWLVALIPNQKTSVKTIFRGQVLNGHDQYQIEVRDPLQALKPGQTLETTHNLFAGAKVLRLLDNYEAKLGFDRFDLAVDFGWFYFLTKPLFYVLEYLHKLFGNFGLAILALTVLFKVAFFPLANKSYRSMSLMKKFQPKVEALKKKYGSDKLRMNQELMELYRKEKIKPLAGCLPMIIQAPVFFCLYKVLFVTLEMRHAPFYGWIKDLSAPDPTSIFNVFGLLPWTPPSFLMIGAWPVIMGLTMFVQQRMNPQPADPAQAKIFMLMPIFLTFFLASFPAGLVIYWAWNNILSMAQQWAIMRMENQRLISETTPKYDRNI
jgi:YidC/Oxa1 family membrane protein insertase